MGLSTVARAESCAPMSFGGCKDEEILAEAGSFLSAVHFIALDGEGYVRAGFFARHSIVVTKEGSVYLNGQRQESANLTTRLREMVGRRVNQIDQRLAEQRLQEEHAHRAAMYAGGPGRAVVFF
jgi:hypothetical protein